MKVDKIISKYMWYENYILIVGEGTGIENVRKNTAESIIASNVLNVADKMKFLEIVLKNTPFSISDALIAQTTIKYTA